MKLVIFDLDDTLIDFASTRQVAYGLLAKAVEREGIEGAGFIDACTRVDRPLFLEFEQGRLTRAQYRLRRFADPFQLLKLTPRDGLVEHLNKLFMDCVNDSPLLYEDARPILAELRRRGVNTAILTNGPSDGQRRKLAATGLGEAVDHVGIGEEIGCSKPVHRAYHSVVERFALPHGDALMVGDSPELDYDGALGAGLRALLLDRQAQHGAGSRQAIATLEHVLHHLPAR